MNMKVPARHLSYAVSYLDAQQEESKHCLEAAGLSREEVFVEGFEVPIESFNLFIEKLLENRSNIVDLAIDLGNFLPPTAHGEMSMGLLTAPTLRHAIEFIQNFYELGSTAATFQFEQSGQSLRTFYSFKSCSTKVDRFLGFVTIPIANRLLSLYTGNPVNISRISLVNCNADEKTQLQAYFPSCHIETEASVNSIDFSNSLLDCTSALADQQAHQNAVNACSKLLKEGDPNQQFIFKLKNIILSNIKNPPSLEKTSELLNISARHLRYQLDQKNTSYQKLVTGLKIEFAKEKLINSSSSIAEIGYMLGYSEPSNFSLSFKRWTGFSPKQFRELKPAKQSTLTR